MKKRFNRIISAILVLASLLSLFAVFAAADDTVVTDAQNDETAEEPVDVSQLEIVYNRNFEEGWEYNNGFSKITNHKAYVDFEETATYKYNYFWRIEASTSAKEGVSTLDFKNNTIINSGTTVSFDIKVDDACDLGKILSMTTQNKKAIPLLYIKGTTLYAFESGNKSLALGELTDDWLNLTFVFDWDARVEGGSADDTVFTCRLYYGNEGKYIDFQKPYEQDKDNGMRTLSFGIGAASGDREGMSYCIDNLRIYQKVKGIVDISNSADYGIKIDNLFEKTVDVQDGPGNKSVEQTINESLCLKVGVDSALFKNVKTSIKNYCTPTIVDGNVMIPLSLILDFIGYPYYQHGESYDITTGTSATYITIGSDTVNVDGTRVDLAVAPGYLTNESGAEIPVIAAADVPNIFPGWLVTYDDMGLVIIYSGEASEDGEALISRDTDLAMMLTIMKKFVFDTVITDSEGNAFEEIDDSYTATGNKVLDDAKNNGAKHPYIFANQEKFDGLKATYTATENVDETAKGYLATLVAEADAIYTEYAKLDAQTGAYVGILDGKKPVNVYGDGKNPDPLDPADETVPDTTDGYSPAGNLDSVELYTGLLVKLAFAYQITGKEEYARLAYDVSVALTEWTHWGPGNMINCATATANFAVAYDWLYNFYLANYGQEKVDLLAAALYNKGVKQGYNSSKGSPCEFARVQGEGDRYTTLNTSWNAVCSSGMIIGALTLLDYDAYRDTGAYLIGNNMQNLIANGLDQYAPDGSYAESALMWADATNGFVKLIMALESATGTTYGFEDTWGLDETFYFACYIEDSDGKIWNYHEGGPDGKIGVIEGIDTQMFNYAGGFLNDSTLIAIRKNQLEKGKPVTMFDMLFYPDADADEQEELQLDYSMAGIHAFVSRSDWNNGALYTGIMGGANDVYGGQLDSGNFIYRNKGVTWFMDLGSDNEEIYSYNGSYRNHHYRHNAEGQNVILITSAQDALPYGQDKAGNGKITATYSNQYGSYALLDNKSAYGTAVTYATRGLLVTNNRKTVVVQDEISFPKFQDITWIAHTASHITVDPSGQVAYLIDTDENGAEVILRATIVSSASYSFKVESATSNLLNATYKNSDYKANGGIYPYDRTGIQRLVITAKNAITFNVAVVFEIVETQTNVEPVGYTWSFMSAWEPVEDSTIVTETVVNRDTPSRNDIISEADKLKLYFDLGFAFTTEIDAFYKSLTQIAYTLKTYKPEDLEGDLIIQSYDSYMDYRSDYENFAKKINSSIEKLNNTAKKLSGIN